MIVRPARNGDLPAIRALTDAEGWGYEEHDLRRLLALSGDGFLVATAADGTIRGALSVLPYASAAWIGNVVVDSAARGGGVGRLLMDAAHAFCRHASLPHVYLDAYPPAIGFYEALGYAADGETRRWSLAVPAPAAPPVAPPSALGAPSTRGAPSALGEGDLEALVASDARLLDSGGATHRRVLLAHLMRDYPGWALGTRDARGALAAWGLARPGATSSEIGPLGGEPAAAESLADALLARLAGRIVELSVPADNIAASRWLDARGFAQIGWHLRMYCGTPLAWDRARTWALGGLEKG